MRLGLTAAIRRIDPRGGIFRKIGRDAEQQNQRGRRQLLSMELEGRSYGGGVLKLEPTEMQRVCLLLPDCGETELEQLFGEADRLIRAGRYAEAVERVDRLILTRQLGLSGADLERLRSGRDALVWTRLAYERLVEDALRVAFRRGHDVRTQLPLAIDDSSEPQPDIAVVTGSPRDYRDAHPNTAVLIVEVAESSVEFDRTRKFALYARKDVRDRSKNLRY